MQAATYIVSCCKKEGVIPTAYREEFKGYVVKAVIRKIGCSTVRASAMVESSALGALMQNNASYIMFKGAEYWANKIMTEII